MKKYKTEQEEFWVGDFGDKYINRNRSDQYLASNLNFFSQVLKRVGKISSVIEFGANIGMNLKAIKLLYPEIKAKGIEINKEASNELSLLIGEQNTFNTSIFDCDVSAIEKSDLSLIKGVLIHINPEMLSLVYDKLYEASSKYILICEYYNPTPVMINYRGHENRLFKRDFAGDILAVYKDLELIDYGFFYKGDPAFPQDDITWFLMKKQK